MSIGKVIIWGEFPPNTHTGISVSNQLVLSILNEDGYSVKVIEEYTWNKKILKKVNNIFSNYCRLFKHAVSRNINTLYFNVPLSLYGLLKFLIVLLWFKIFSRKTKLIGHLHRGDFSKFISKNVMNRFILKWNLRLINKIIVLSQIYLKDVYDFYNNIEICVLHNTSGFETKLKRNDYTYNGKYLCISNYIKSKGIEELVKCFKYKELSNLNLSVYGHIYESSFFNYIQELASDNVTLNEGLKREEISDVLKECDCLIIPSWNEGQPIIVLEAMSLGIPIISTAVGDIPNMLGDQYEFLVNSKDINSLLNGIILFDNYNKKHGVSGCLYERYHSNYSNSSYKNILLEIFK